MTNNLICLTMRQQLKFFRLSSSSIMLVLLLSALLCRPANCSLQLPGSSSHQPDAEHTVEEPNANGSTQRPSSSTRSRRTSRVSWNNQGQVDDSQLTPVTDLSLIGPPSFLSTTSNDARSSTKTTTSTSTGQSPRSSSSTSSDASTPSPTAAASPEDQISSVVAQPPPRSKRPEPSDRCMICLQDLKEALLEAASASPDTAEQEFHSQPSASGSGTSRKQLQAQPSSRPSRKQPQEESSKIKEDKNIFCATTCGHRNAHTSCMRTWMEHSKDKAGTKRESLFCLQCMGPLEFEDELKAGLYEFYEYDGGASISTSQQDGHQGGGRGSRRGGTPRTLDAPASGRGRLQGEEIGTSEASRPSSPEDMIGSTGTPAVLEVHPLSSFLLVLPSSSTAAQGQGEPDEAMIETADRLPDGQDQRRDQDITSADHHAGFDTPPPAPSAASPFPPPPIPDITGSGTTTRCVVCARKLRFRFSSTSSGFCPRPPGGTRSVLEDSDEDYIMDEDGDGVDHNPLGQQQDPGTSPAGFRLLRLQRWRQIRRRALLQGGGSPSNEHSVDEGEGDEGHDHVHVGDRTTITSQPTTDLGEAEMDHEHVGDRTTREATDLDEAEVALSIEDAARRRGLTTHRGSAMDDLHDDEVEEVEGLLQDQHQHQDDPLPASSRTTTRTTTSSRQLPRRRRPRPYLQVDPDSDEFLEDTTSSRPFLFSNSARVLQLQEAHDELSPLKIRFTGCGHGCHLRCLADLLDVEKLCFTCPCKEGILDPSSGGTDESAGGRSSSTSNASSSSSNGAGTGSGSSTTGTATTRTLGDNSSGRRITSPWSHTLTSPPTPYRSELEYLVRGYHRDDRLPRTLRMLRERVYGPTGSGAATTGTVRSSASNSMSTR
ncbi:unnamed protein product, partial [Amoebophrya sp. A25]|eukprot:GSA25T00010054001.1